LGEAGMNECEAMVEKYWQRKIAVSGQKPSSSMPFCQAQSVHGVDQEPNLTSMVKG
jgi:hypothetical protein